MLHDLIHWADLFRHFMAYSWNPYINFSNVTGGLEYAVLALFGAVIFWPKLRHAIEGFFHRTLDKHPLTGLLHKVHTSLGELHEKHDQLDAKHQELLGLHDKLLGAHDQLLAKHDEILAHLKTEPPVPSKPSGRTTAKKAK